MHKDSIVGVGGGSLGRLIPQGGLDDSAVHYAEQMVQDSGMELEPWLMEAVCSKRVTVQTGNVQAPNTWRTESQAAASWRRS